MLFRTNTNSIDSVMMQHILQKRLFVRTLSNAHASTANPLIGVLAWECDNGMQHMRGNIMNPNTFAFGNEIKYYKMDGINRETIVFDPLKTKTQTLNKYITKILEMQNDDNVRAVTTNCGFNALFQSELQRCQDIKIPILTSSILQIPFIIDIIPTNSKICVITANSQTLTNDHFRNCHISNEIIENRLLTYGIENVPEYKRRLTLKDDELLDEKLFISQTVDFIDEIIIQQCNQGINIGAILMECTDLPPVSPIIRKKHNIPVFDVVTMLNTTYQTMAN